jgi:DNA polymerase elongation subunit (family B)
MPYALRFMIDNKIGGMSWLKIEKNNYNLRTAADKYSTAQIEIDISDFN